MKTAFGVTESRGGPLHQSAAGVVGGFASSAEMSLLLCCSRCIKLAFLAFHPHHRGTFWVKQSLTSQNPALRTDRENVSFLKTKNLKRKVVSKWATMCKTLKRAYKDVQSRRSRLGDRNEHTSAARTLGDRSRAAPELWTGGPVPVPEPATVKRRRRFRGKLPM